MGAIPAPKLAWADADYRWALEIARGFPGWENAIVFTGPTLTGLPSLYVSTPGGRGANWSFRIEGRGDFVPSTDYDLREELALARKEGRVYPDCWEPVVETDPIRRLQKWADADKDRYFEIRYIADSKHPWAVELSNDSVSWTVTADVHDSLDFAVDHALEKAAEEEP